MSNASMVSQGNVFKQMKNRSCSDRMSRPAFWAMLSEIMALKKKSVANLSIYDKFMHLKLRFDSEI